MAGEGGRAERFLNGLGHGPEPPRWKAVLWPKPVLGGVNSTQNFSRCSGQHHRAGCKRIVIANEMLWHPAVGRRSPDGQRGQASFFVTSGKDVEQRLPATQHPAPIVPHEFEVRTEAGSPLGIEN